MVGSCCVVIWKVKRMKWFYIVKEMYENSIKVDKYIFEYFLEKNLWKFSKIINEY